MENFTTEEIGRFPPGKYKVTLTIEGKEEITCTFTVSGGDEKSKSKSVKKDVVKENFELQNDLDHYPANLKVAITEIRKLGGKLVVDSKNPDKPIIAVNLQKTKVTDDQLVKLKLFTHLKHLCLYHTQITDKGLIHLKELKNLNTLIIDKTSISDAGLLHLMGFINLKQINLRDTKVTPAGVKKLQTALPNCKIIR